MSKKPKVSVVEKATLTSDSQEQDPSEEELFSKQVRIVVTSSSYNGDLRGRHQTLVNMAEDNSNGGGEYKDQSLKSGEESKSRGWFSFLGSSSSKKEPDNSDAKATQNGATYDYDDEERYNVNNLRVPSMLEDKEQEENPMDDDSILKDPYGDIRPREGDDGEPMMKDEEHDEFQDKQVERRRFFMCLTSKTLFLIGSMLFLVLAVSDYQRIEGAAAPADASATNLDGTSVPPTPNVDDDFVYEALDVTELEEEMEMAATRKDERAGSAITTLNGDSRRRAKAVLRRAATNWYTQYWEDLPDDVKEGAKLLGYDQANWDSGSSVYTDRLHWDELTPGQQEAAFLVFAYEEDSWNDYVDRFLADTPAPTTPSPTEPTVDDSSAQNGEQGTEEVGEGETNEETLQDEGDVDNSQGNGGETGVGGTGDTGDTGDQGSDGNEEVDSTTPEVVAEPGQEGTPVEAANGGPAEAGESDEDSGRGDSVSAFSNGYSISIQGEYPAEERGKNFQVLYICAAACFVLVGIFDALHQQLGFHIVMVFAGITGIMAGIFLMSNEKAFHICHSLSTHFFLLQAVLLIYSRLLLTYDNSVRRILNFADALFFIGALMNVVVSYMRYDETSLAMTKSALAASVFWVVAAIIYVSITVLFWAQRNRSNENATSGVTNGDVSVQESCNVMENNEGFCEVSLLDTDRPEV